MMVTLLAFASLATWRVCARTSRGRLPHRPHGPLVCSRGGGEDARDDRTGGLGQGRGGEPGEGKHQRKKWLLALFVTPKKVFSRS